MSKFFEVKGRYADELRKFRDDLDIAVKKMHVLAEKYGGEKIGLYNTFAPEFVLMQKESPGLDWRNRTQTKDQWTPRKSTKAGLRILEEMKSICSETPSIMRICRLLDIPPTGPDMRLRTPGLTFGLGRVAINTPGYWSPAGDVSEFVERISDMEYEKIRAAHVAESEAKEKAEAEKAKEGEACTTES